MQFSEPIMFSGGALNATLTLLTELVMSGMKGMGFKDLFQVTLTIFDIISFLGCRKNFFHQ